VCGELVERPALHVQVADDLDVLGLEGERSGVDAPRPEMLSNGGPIPNWIASSRVFAPASWASPTLSISAGPSCRAVRHSVTARLHYGVLGR
jgi:hypothetical protein